jgi:hypothetical protein
LNPLEVIVLRKFVWTCALLATVVACSSVKQVVVKDIPLEEQEAVLEKYKDRFAWTRVTVQDLGEGGTIPRDEKVKIVDVAMHHEGSVTVETLKRKNRVVQGLTLARPLNPAKIDSALAEYFWFEDPTIRHVGYIREYGKETAKAIMNHDLFAGMTMEAAMESWGKPIKRETSERGGVQSERWSYPTATPGRFRNIDFQNGKVTRWDE